MVSYDDAQARMQELGLELPAWNNTVIVAEAMHRGIEVSGSPSGRRVNLTFGEKKQYWQKGRSSLNTMLARQCVELKEVASRLLRKQGVSAPENCVFGAHDMRRAWHWAEPILPVVVKPDDGIQGQGVHVNITTYAEFEDAFQRVSSRHDEVLVEQFIQGADHRVLVVGNRVVAVTHRIPANVTGDGTSTIRQLVEVKNQDRGVVHQKLRLNEVTDRHLARQGLTSDSVVEQGRTIYLRGTANLHTGGDVADATDDLTAEEIAEVEAASRAIPGLRVAGFDVLLPREPGHGPLSILEANSNPMISGHHFPWFGSGRDAAGAVLDAMFPATAIERPHGYRID